MDGRFLEWGAASLPCQPLQSSYQPPFCRRTPVRKAQPRVTWPIGAEARHPPCRHSATPARVSLGRPPRLLVAKSPGSRGCSDRHPGVSVPRELGRVQDPPCMLLGLGSLAAGTPSSRWHGTHPLSQEGAVSTVTGHPREGAVLLGAGPMQPLARLSTQGGLPGGPHPTAMLCQAC